MSTPNGPSNNPFDEITGGYTPNSSGSHDSSGGYGATGPGFNQGYGQGYGQQYGQGAGQGYGQGYGQQYGQDPYYGQTPAYGVGAYGGLVPAKPKSKVIALILCLFLGTLGVHHFYLGNKNYGIAMLVLTILGWVTAIVLIGFLFLVVTSVWAFIDLILILIGGGYMARDSNGLELTWEV